MTQEHFVTTEDREGIEIVTLLYKPRWGDAMRAEIAPSLGNNCFRFGFLDCEYPRPILEPVSFDDFLTKPTSYGIPILFPFPNRIRDGQFTFQGQSYTVDPPRHGFVRDKAWEVIGTGVSQFDGAWLRSRFDAAKYADQILRQFPSLFVLEMTYQLHKKNLQLEVTAQNTGDRDMPVGFGIHPYFRTTEETMILVPAFKRWELVDNLPTGNVLTALWEYDWRVERTLAGAQIDEIFTDLMPERNGNAYAQVIERSRMDMTVIEFSAQQFPHCVVYTPPAPRRAVCIEPNTCPTDAFNLQARGIESNVIVLKPGERTEFKINIYST